MRFKGLDFSADPCSTPKGLSRCLSNGAIWLYRTYRFWGPSTSTQDFGSKNHSDYSIWDLTDRYLGTWTVSEQLISQATNVMHDEALNMLNARIRYRLRKHSILRREA